MTAHGRAIANSTLGRVIVEIQSVNRKFLDINLQIPSELKRFEGEVKKWLAEEILCGQIRVTILAQFYDHQPVVITPNIPLVRNLQGAWKEIANEINVNFDEQFNLSFLKDHEGLFLYHEDVEHNDQYLALLKEAVLGALDQFIEMRVREGQVLSKDLLKRLELLKILIEKIASKVSDAPQKYFEKLLKKLDDLIPENSVENRERLLREIVIHSERLDVTEEITRFKSHIEQLEKMFMKPGGGKSIDFLLQELGREINTLGSKALDIEVSHWVVDVKSELAKIKEQIQNVE